jgi:hypothetical protein
MQFTLTYSGELRANARPDHKHELRKAFHSQLQVLWNQVPLSDYQHWYNPTSKKTTIDLNRRVGPFRFVPLISPDLHLVCELQISMLKPEPPGAIVTQGGDIDNRLKTLFDALRFPKVVDELPSNPAVGPDQDPFFCLLEDDALITGISVKTDRLLRPLQSTSEVHLDIQVSTRPTRMLVGNRVVGGFDLA